MGSNSVNKWNSNGILGKSFYLSFRFHLFKKIFVSSSLRNFLALISLILPPSPASSSQHSHHAINLQEIASNNISFLFVSHILTSKWGYMGTERIAPSSGEYGSHNLQPKTWYPPSHFEDIGLVLIQETLFGHK